MSLGKRVDEPSWRHPESTGKGKLGVGPCPLASPLVLKTGEASSNLEGKTDSSKLEEPSLKTCAG